MTYAFDWFTPYHNDQILYVKIHHSENSIALLLYHEQSFTKFNYSNSQGSTTIECDKLKKNDTVEGCFIDLFCKDLVAILVNHKSVVEHLAFIDCREDTEKLTVVNRLYQCLVETLKLKNRIIRVNLVHMNPFIQDHSMSFVRLLDPSELLDLSFVFRDLNWDDQDFVPLVEWKEGYRRMNLELIFSKHTMETLYSIKKLLSHSSTFRIIKCTTYTSVRSLLASTFDPYRPIIVDDHRFRFDLDRISRQPVSREENELSALLEQLCLTESLALQVLGNPLVMKVIVKEFQFYDIQHLRKVSRDIRDCIDYLKPDPHISSYSLTQSKIGRMQMRNVLWGDTIERLRYVIVGSDGRRIVVEVCAITSLNDFVINLQYQKSLLEELHIEQEDYMIMNLISLFLEQKNDPLRVRKLKMKVKNQEDLMKVLLYLDQDSIETIEITSYKDAPELHLDCIATLNQWRKSKNLVVAGVVVDTPIRELNIIGFANVELTVRNISTEDVVHLKKELIKSATLEKFKITFENNTIDGSLHNSIPPYRRVLGVRSIWYFQMNTPEKFLHIVYQERTKQFVFSCKGREDVPEDII